MAQYTHGAQRVKHAIRQWMSGENYYDARNPICSSFSDILNYRGVPVAFCYHSRVTEKRHYIVGNNCPDRVMRYLKRRDCIEVGEEGVRLAINVVNHNFRRRSMNDTWIAGYVREVNTFMRQIGGPAMFKSGEDYIGGRDQKGLADKLTVMLYRMEQSKSPPVPYVVKALHDSDIETLSSTERWISLGDNWFGTRDLGEFTLFKIGRVNSIPIEVL